MGYTGRHAIKISKCISGYDIKKNGMFSLSETKLNVEYLSHKIHYDTGNHWDKVSR